MTSFADLIQRFFGEYLAAQRSVSPNTQTAYRHTFRLLLLFLSHRHRKSVDQLTITSFTPEAILAFLDYLEKKRGNTVRTRNTRLAAIRSFARFALGVSAPDFIVPAQRILAIPAKCYVKPVLGFMTRPQLSAVLAAIDTTTWSGQRDRLFFSLLYNTGARVSEALQLQVHDVQGRVVHLKGKGRKNRTVPLWPQVERRFRQWCQSNNLSPDGRIFSNYSGAPLTREGIAFRLNLAVRKAAQSCPSLAQRKITPHTFRHTAGTHLLQSGVPLEIISLWMGHERPSTTHVYVEADLKMKQDCINRLDDPTPPGHKKRSRGLSNLLGFLEAR